jgi:hypothetical protein
MGIDYPSETFRVLINKEMNVFGEHRTQRLVLESCDRLEAGAHWCQNGLLTDGSLYTDKALWQLENLKLLDQYFVNQPDDGPGGFFDKLSTQLASTAPHIKQLAAEILWVMLLCPSNTGQEKRRLSNNMRMVRGAVA